MVDGIASSSQQCRMSLGEGGSMKGLIRRYVAEGRPKVPNSLVLKIENDWELTKDGEGFLLYDNGPDSLVRILLSGF